MNSGRLCADAGSPTQNSARTSGTTTVNARRIDSPFMALLLPVSLRLSTASPVQGSPPRRDQLVFRQAKAEGTHVDIPGTIGGRELRRAPRLVERGAVRGGPQGRATDRGAGARGGAPLVPRPARHSARQANDGR